MVAWLQVNAGECTSWKLSLFMDHTEDSPEVLKGVSLIHPSSHYSTSSHTYNVQYIIILYMTCIAPNFGGAQFLRIV